MKPTILILIVSVLTGCTNLRNSEPNEPSSIPHGANKEIDFDETKFIEVQGVYTLPTLNKLRKAGSEPLGSIWSFDHFSYIPSTGNSFSEAVKVRSWNCGSGALAEGVLLSVLFGAKAQSTTRDYRTESIDKKHYHIYKIETSDNNNREVYFDATQYHGLY